MPELTEHDKIELERLIDRTTLETVLEALMEICGEKADHIESEWQDRATAAPWRMAAKTLGKAIDRVEV